MTQTNTIDLTKRMITLLKFLQEHGPRVDIEKVDKEVGLGSVMSLECRGLAQYVDRNQFGRATAVELTEAGRAWPKKL